MVVSSRVMTQNRSDLGESVPRYTGTTRIRARVESSIDDWLLVQIGKIRVSTDFF